MHFNLLQTSLSLLPILAHLTSANPTNLTDPYNAGHYWSNTVLSTVSPHEIFSLDIVDLFNAQADFINEQIILFGGDKVVGIDPYNVVQRDRTTGEILLSVQVTGEAKQGRPLTWATLQYIFGLDLPDFYPARGEGDLYSGFLILVTDRRKDAANALVNPGSVLGSNGTYANA